MRMLSTSVTALAAIGIVASVGATASACEWMKTATATPVPEEVAAPATNVDPVQLAELGSEAIVPRPPEEVSEAEAE